jgi:phosphonate metabolism protein PhnN/1,5-bisphosphokinase (PRPP-forming)
MANGALVLVVGPSGAGKDTLIGAAKTALRNDARFSFPRRVVTRTAVVELEDHDSVSPEAFARQRQDGAYALEWDAHGLSYGVPAEIDAELAAGRTVVVNTSRKVIESALARYPNCHVMLVTARPEVRALRLGARGRETPGEIAARLAREGAPVPDNVQPIVIDNSGSLSEAVALFAGELLKLAR